MDQEVAVRALAALANGHRLQVFRALVAAGGSGLSASELALAAGIGATTLTFHTKELERAGLIRSWREGRRIRSALNTDAMRALLAFLSEDCCGGRPELCGPPTDAHACCEAPSVDGAETSTNPPTSLRRRATP